MLGFSRKTNQSYSKDQAVGRLKMVLTTDRIPGAAQMLEQMKNDILDVMRRYVIIDEQDIDIEISPQGGRGDVSESSLKANIPLRNIKRL